MITPRGQVKVLDFGLAKIDKSREVVGDASTLLSTASGLLMGTISYMSPEQALGRDVDHRTDIFSLGVVMYEMATGCLPFSGGSAGETIERIVHAHPEAIARLNYSISAELERIVRKCMEKERERRYQSARDLVVDLRNWDRDTKKSERPAPQSRKHSRKSIDSLAVLPIENSSADPEMDYLSDGITGSIINSLAQLPKLHVMSQGTTFRYKGREFDPQQIGRDLAVRAVLMGRILQRGGRVFISAELVDTSDGCHLWGAQYTCPFSDIFAVQVGLAYAQKKMYEGAISEFQRALQFSGDSDAAAALGHVYAILGNKDEAKAVLAQLKKKAEAEYVPSYDVAIIHVALGETDEAFEWLHRAYEERCYWLIYLKVDPILDTFRSDPRLTDLIRRIGL